MRTASKIITILLAISLIGGLQTSHTIPYGTMDIKPFFMVIRLFLAILFAYFGWRPKKKDNLKITQQKINVKAQEVSVENSMIINTYKQKRINDSNNDCLDKTIIRQDDSNYYSNSKMNVSKIAKSTVVILLIITTIILANKMVNKKNELESLIKKIEKTKESLTEFKEKIPKLLRENESYKTQILSTIEGLRIENDSIANKIINEDKLNCMTTIHFSKNGSIARMIEITGNIKVERTRFGEYIIRRNNKEVYVIDRGYHLSNIFIVNNSTYTERNSNYVPTINSIPDFRAPINQPIRINPFLP